MPKVFLILLKLWVRRWTVLYGLISNVFSLLIGGYAKFNSIKQYNKDLRTLLAIGGWVEGSSRFSELVSFPDLRKHFIDSAIRHIRRHNFDGLDLDWEYPASRPGSLPEDRENYALLVQVSSNNTIFTWYI